MAREDKVKKDKTTYHLTIRWYKGGERALCRYVGRDGPAEFCLMHGELTKDTTVLLIKQMKGLGVQVEEENSPFEPPVREQPKKESKGGFGL